MTRPRLIWTQYSALTPSVRTSRRHQQFTRPLAYPGTAPHRGSHHGPSSVRFNQRARSERSRSRRSWTRCRSPTNWGRGIILKPAATQARPRRFGCAERVGRWYRPDTSPADPGSEIRAGRPRELATFPAPRSRRHLHRLYADIRRRRPNCGTRIGEARTQSRDGGKGLARGEGLDGRGDARLRSTKRHLSRTAPDRVDPRCLRDCARSDSFALDSRRALGSCGLLSERPLVVEQGAHRSCTEWCAVTKT